VLLEHAESIAGTAGFGAEVQVRDDDGIDHMCTVHAALVAPGYARYKKSHEISARAGRDDT
jgi:hypothetical protein